nr:LptF/LptG family permease [Desulfobulbaceae bacterium]
MTLLDRYLIKQFFKNLLLIVCALVSIYLLVDFFERIDNFMNAKMPMSLAAKYFLLKIPFMIDMLQPVCILLAGVITLGLLNHNHEFMALKAGGISTSRITRPLLLSACLVSLAALGFAEWILPPTFTQTERIWNEEVHQKIPKGILRKGRTYFRGEQGIYTFIRSTEGKDTFTDFAYTELTSRFEPKLLLTAKKALWDGKWTFYDGQTKTPVSMADNTYTITLFEQTTVSLPETPEDFFAPTYKTSEQSISTLFSNLTDAKSDKLLEMVNLHSRLSFIFLGLPLIFIGLPVILLISNKWRRDLTLAVPVSCGLAFAAWIWWSTSQSMAKAAYLPPIVAAWAMPLIICPLGFWLLRRQE